MKPVFKCDYCSKIGTKEEIKEHEPICHDNYDRKNCYTCIHKTTEWKDKQLIYKCKAKKEIPEGKIYEFCESYEKKVGNSSLYGLFNNIFGL